MTRIDLQLQEISHINDKINDLHNRIPHSLRECNEIKLELSMQYHYLKSASDDLVKLAKEHIR